MKTTKLSDAALRYMSALYDPKNCPEEASVPSETQLSLKLKTFGRGSFATGTSGYGGIVVQPLAMLANNIQFAAATAANSVGGAAANFSGGSGTFTNLTSLGSNNSPYALAAFGQGVGLLGWKLVGCALYVKYAGTELNRGGDMILVEDPSHQSLLPQSYNSVMGFDYSKRVPITEDWQHVCATPSESLDTDFTYGTLSNWNTGELPYLACFINSAGATQPFDYEIYCIFEVVGTTARGATISFNDPIGFAAVTGAADQLQQLDSVVGMSGFVRCVEDQLRNMTGLPQNCTSVQNWAGLTTFLPQLAELAMPILKGAANGAIKSLGYTKVKPKNKPPPPPVYRAPPPPPLKIKKPSAQIAKIAAVLKKR